MTDTLSDQPRKIWFRLAQVAAACGLLFLLLLDLQFDSFTSESTEIAVAEFLAFCLVAFALLISHRLGRILLPLAGIVVACWSLGVTALNAGLVEFGGGAFGFAETAGMLLLLIMVVRRSHQWLVVVGGGALVLAVGAQPLRNGMSDSDIIIGLLFALVAGSVAATGAYLRSLDGSRQRQVQLVRAEQRAELARDLHDFVAHHVTGIVVQAQGARIIAAQDPERVAAALEQIEKAGAEAMASMRRMVGMLRDTDADPDAPVAPLAGIADLPALLEGFNSADEITAHLHVEGALDDLPVEITSSAYRIVMEALTNVRRHAHRASRVDVVLHRTPEWLLVRVTDDGHGGHARGAPGFGLIGLNERVHALSGRIQAGPGPVGGWVIDAALPLAKSAVRAVRG